MKYIGIDFSIISPGICVMTEDGTTKFYNIQRNKIPKKYKEAFDNNINMIYADKIPNDLSYKAIEVFKATEAIVMAAGIINMLEKNSDNENLIVGIEGFSYGGIGSRTLDLAGFQYVLRAELIKLGCVSRIEVYTPGEIKKYAIKGNASKEQMMEAYLALKVDNDLTTLMTNESILSANKFPKPIDDLVDAFFIADIVRVNDQKL